MKRLLIIAGLLSFLIGLGTVAFYLLGGHTWLESTYLAVVTLTTLGSRDPASTDAEMLFVMIYMCLGLGMFSYSIFSLGQILVDTRLREQFKRRKMEKEIQRLSDHYIICGLGRMGRTICEYLEKRGKQFVVIDRDTEILELNAVTKNWLNISGDATDDATLKLAGIDRAHSLASVLPSDADNVYVVLTARMLNPGMPIVARASNDKAIIKMEHAGASKVISPFSSGAVKIARIMINPSLENFLEVADVDHGESELAEFVVPENCSYAGKTLADANISNTGVMVLGIRHPDGKNEFPANANSILNPGDRLLMFGDSQAINAMISSAESSAEQINEESNFGLS